MRKRTEFALLLVVVVLAARCQTLYSDTAGAAALRLAAIFGNDMVLQRDMEVPIWGWSEPGAVVRVTRGGEVPLEVTAGVDGKWMARLASIPAGGPHEVTIASGKKSIALTNVMMGDVWICSGQSNMQWPIWAKTGKSALYAQYPVAESANAVYPNIRLYMVPMTTSLDPQEDIPRTDTPMYSDEPAEILRKWRVCTPETVPPFSAVAYFFGRAIHRDVTVPVGLIQTAWGGTVCEAWTSADTLRGHPDFGAEVTRLQEDATPLQQLLQEYEAALAAWQKKAVAADTGYANGEPAWAELREAQLMALSLPKTGMAVTIDIGDAKDIHPKNKQGVGERLALAARHVAYGEELAYSGPIYSSMKIKGDTIRIRFDHVGSGLVARGGPPTGFAIAGEDGKFIWADARIEGETVVVCAPGLTRPVAVRYAWAANPFCNFFNAEGLPASPFRTDNLPGLTVMNR